MGRTLVGAALSVCVACGGSDHDVAADAGHDGAPADVAIDATAAGVVTLTIVNLGGPSVAGLQIVFENADGTSPMIVPTNASGVASATVLPRSTVIAVIPSGATSNLLLTYLDVMPGDSLVVGAPAPSAPTMYGTADVRLPTTPFATADHYEISVGCTQLTTSTPTGNLLQLTSECLSAGGTYDVIGYALDASSKQLAFSTSSNLAPPAMNTTAVIALGSWRTDFDTITFAATNAPASSASVEATISPKHDKVQYVSNFDTKPVTQGGSVGVALNVAKGTWNHDYYQFTLKRTNGPTTVIFKDVATLPGVVPIDLSTMLPFVHDLSADVPSGHLAPTFHYVADGSIASAQGVLFQFTYTDAGGAYDTIIGVGPATIPSALALPPLPDTLAARRPGTTFTPASFQLLVLDSLWTDAKDFREHWGRATGGALNVGESLRASQL